MEAENQVEEVATENREFNPESHLMPIGDKVYLPVQWRIVWFRGKFPHGTIKTKMIHLDLDRPTEETREVWNDGKKETITKRANGFVIFRAVVTDGQGGIATGTKTEKAASFPDFIEKAETGAIGRALAALGYGTQFTAGEMDEEHRIVDSPNDRKKKPSGKQIETIKKLATTLKRPAPWAESAEEADEIIRQLKAECEKDQKPTNTKDDPNSPATLQQLGAIRNVSKLLDREEPNNLASLTEEQARTLIAKLNNEYGEIRKQKRQ